MIRQKVDVLHIVMGVEGCHGSDDLPQRQASSHIPLTSTLDFRRGCKTSQGLAQFAWQVQSISQRVDQRLASLAAPDHRAGQGLPTEGDAVVPRAERQFRVDALVIHRQLETGHRKSTAGKYRR